MTPPEITPPGVLVVDKPEGPTSHDVVARVRRALRLRRIGHTGTLDPLASGVLPLVLGSATRLARFLSSDRKCYEAVIRLGYATDTCDRAGSPVTHPATGYGPVPPPAVVNAAVTDLSGRTFEQTPPAYSAKKIDGTRAYALARAGRAVAPRPVTVTLHDATIVGIDGADVSVRITCSAGFYVRSLAHDLGARLGCGGFLQALRRTASGPFSVDTAVPLGEIERDPTATLRHLVPIDRLLPHSPAAHLAAAGVERARHGNLVGPQHIVRTDPSTSTGVSTAVPTRLVAPDGTLVAVASGGELPGGLLHPDIVLV